MIKVFCQIRENDLPMGQKNDSVTVLKNLNKDKIHLEICVKKVYHVEDT